MKYVGRVTDKSYYDAIEDKSLHVFDRMPDDDTLMFTMLGLEEGRKVYDYQSRCRVYAD